MLSLNDMGIENSVFKYAGTMAQSCRAAGIVLALVSCGAAEAPADTPGESPVATPTGRWSPEQATRLVERARAQPREALPVPDTRELEAAIAAGDPAGIDRDADALALRIARGTLFGVADTARRAGWNIHDSDTAIDIAAGLRDALAAGRLDAFLDGLQPEHPDYAALRAAYAAEPDAARRATLARNMERWRWMPHALGRSYVLVNTAAFEASLWHEGKRAGTWKVIVGKPSTPSPVFSARISGVTFNPWWDIPASIIAEKHGNFPASQGYVRSATGFRQKPGPGNALGQMKLVMPNPYNVYMHDTPSKSLFNRDVRAFSHGCIRVGDPMDLAATLLSGSRTRGQIDGIVASGMTVTVDLPAPVPVYITYFTASLKADGTVAVHPDVYGRDARVGAVALTTGTECSGHG